MALSRAAAAAARKAAKSRGLQGNRADDGSMLTDTSRYVPHEKYNEIVRSTHDRIDAKTAAAMSDDELVAAFKKADQEMSELHMYMRENEADPNFNRQEFKADEARLSEKMKTLEDEMDARPSFDAPEGGTIEQIIREEDF